MPIALKCVAVLILFTGSLATVAGGQRLVWAALLGYRYTAAQFVLFGLLAGAGILGVASAVLLLRLRAPGRYLAVLYLSFFAAYLALADLGSFRILGLALVGLTAVVLATPAAGRVCQPAGSVQRRSLT